MDRLGGLVVIAPARTAGDPGLNPGPGDKFSLKLLRCTKYILELTQGICLTLEKI